MQIWCRPSKVPSLPAVRAPTFALDTFNAWGSAYLLLIFDASRCHNCEHCPCPRCTWRPSSRRGATRASRLQQESRRALTSAHGGPLLRVGLERAAPGERRRGVHAAEQVVQAQDLGERRERGRSLFQGLATSSQALGQHPYLSSCDFPQNEGAIHRVILWKAFLGRRFAKPAARRWRDEVPRRKRRVRLLGAGARRQEDGVAGTRGKGQGTATGGSETIADSLLEETCGQAGNRIQKTVVCHRRTHFSHPTLTPRLLT
jgi:hypothetical protein